MLDARATAVGRRTLLVAVVLAPLMSLLGVEAQAARTPKVGCLGTAPSPLTELFIRKMGELGWVRDRNVVLEYRYSHGQLERFPELARELVAQKVDVLYAVSEPAVRAAVRATTTIPVVMVVADDPVGAGLVPSLARPGGNVTGFAAFQPDLVGKRLELLRELVPRLSRVAVLGNPADPAVARAMKAAEAVAASRQLTIQTFSVSQAADLDGIFAEIGRTRPDGLLVLQNATTFINRHKIVELAARYRLPAIYGERAFVAAGGLISYSTSFDEAIVSAAEYVDRILRGARPADLPIRQASRFELLVNLNPAKPLGLTVPPSLLQRADEIVQ
jgi:putative ABC transport system substrate-binding protein